MPTVKPGYQTSEFWFLLLAQVIAALVVAGVFAPGSVAAKCIAIAGSILSALGYGAVRASVKNASQPADPPPSV